VKIAAVACESQIVAIVCAAVLLCHDVLNVMSEFGVCLAEAAIFAPLACAAADEVARGPIHLLLGYGVDVPASFEF
jgi:hypothetical protein